MVLGTFCIAKLPSKMRGGDIRLLHFFPGVSSGTTFQLCLFMFITVLPTP